MVFTFFGLSLVWLAGFQICRIFSAGMDYPINHWILAGAGFFIATALLIFWLSSVPLPLHTASWGAVFFSALIAFPLTRFIRTCGSNFKLSRARLPHFIMITLILAHLALVLANNLSRDIYPWDAFTTWIYRAKVWVLSNELLTFQTVDQWLQSGGEGYALRAAHYPASVSTMAAFSSALSGGWSDHAASLPWFFATLAIGSLMFGLCRHNGLDGLSSLVGTYLLISIPLVSIHGVLAGYADLWMLGSSGMGLAALLLWSQEPRRGLLLIGMALLAVGCFIKSEGWIWLGLGMLFTSSLLLWRRYHFAALAGFIAVMLLCISLGYVDLGPLGMWGVHEGRIHGGPLGHYALRPFNALPTYIEVIFRQGNFHLLGGGYLLALVVLALMSPRVAVYHWFMGGLVAGSQWVIFGTSSYSLYAETGTALNRLLLHFLPVFVLTSMTGWQAAKMQWIKSQPISRRGLCGQPLQGGVLVILFFIALSAPALILLEWSSTNSGVKNVQYAPEALVPVLGNLKKLENGRQQFTETPGPVAVAKVRLKQVNQPLSRYIVTTVSTIDPGAVSFYWIHSGDPQVHSYSLDITGTTLLDTHNLGTFSKQPIQEMGYIVREDALDNVELGEIVALERMGPQFFPINIKLWATPEPLSQRSINSTQGHQGSLLSISSWLGLAGLFAVIIMNFLPKRMKWVTFSYPTSLASVLVALWLLSDWVVFRQLCATTSPESCLMSTPNKAVMNTGTKDHLESLVQTLVSMGDTPSRVAAVWVDRSDQFNAQILPLLLAPIGTVSTSIHQLEAHATNWSGTVVLLGGDETRRSEAMEQLSRSFSIHSISKTEIALIFIAGKL